jgi:hypothetical protein
MITANDGYSWLTPRISRDSWVNLMNALASPDVVNERPCGEYYDAINEYHVEPLYVLAKFHAESTIGAAGIARATHSWGNMRTPTDPANGGSSVTIPGRGVFAAYPDWLSGCRDTAAHLATPMYKGLTIREAEYHWAPPSDNNDTEGYIQREIDFINQYADKGVTVARIIVSAGHENIGQLVGHDGGFLGDDAQRLSGGTGAAGEVQLNSATADEVVRLLGQSHPDIEVIRTDARYDDAYANDADLAVFIHADGVNDANAPQHAGCVPMVQKANSDAQARAKAFCDMYKQDAPSITHIENERLDTSDMDGLYNGDFLTVNTPAVCIETCIVGAAGGVVRTDALSSGVAGAAIAKSIVDWGIADGCIQANGADGGVSPSSGGDVGQTGTGGGTGSDSVGEWYTDERGFHSIKYSETGGKLLSGGFGDYYHDTGYHDPTNTDGVSPIYGFPLTNEFVAPGGFFKGTDPNKPIVCQVFERAVMLSVNDGGGNSHVETALTGHRILTDLAAIGAAPADAWRN